MNFPQKFPFGSKRLFLLQFGPKTVSLSILKWAPGICLKLALIMKRQESKNMKCFRKPLGQMGHFYTPNWAQTIKFLILKICSQDVF